GHPAAFRGSPMELGPEISNSLLLPFMRISVEITRMPFDVVCVVTPSIGQDRHSTTQSPSFSCRSIVVIIPRRSRVNHPHSASQEDALGLCFVSDTAGPDLQPSSGSTTVVLMV